MNYSQVAQVGETFKSSVLEPPQLVVIEQSATSPSAVTITN